MPPLVTSLPWLNNQSDPVAAYQRSQQLVQQMQAQQAQERQQQAELAQRAREAAMQASFQQRSLALKEQEARSGVQVEADRLRQKGQALEFEQKAHEAEQRYLQAPPEAVNIPGMPAAIRYRGRLAFPPRTPDVSEVGRSVAVYEDNDPAKRLLGHVARTNERGGAFVAEPRPDLTADKAQAALEGEARSVDRNLLIQERKELSDIINKPGRWEELDPAARTNVMERFSETQRKLDTYRVPPKRAEKAGPQKPAKQVLAEERAKLANKIESENPGWNQGQVMKAVYDQIP